MRSKLTLFVTVAGLALAGVVYLMGADGLASGLLIGVAVIPLVSLIRETIAKLKLRRPGVDVIAILAVGASLALGEFLTAAIIGVMLATGQYLEEYAAGRAERELTALISRAPRTAHRILEGAIEEVEVDQIGPGDRVMVKAGEVVPVDGFVLGESALIDESALTGEPLPKQMGQGDLISSGSVNAADVFEIQATAGADQSTYAGIIRLVELARSSRPASVRLADRWAAWFVPLTLLVAGLAWALSGDPVRALAVLVVATPCPLLLAVPIAIVSGISRAAHRGIVFRGGGALENLAQTRNILIDKTGTVTVGRPALRSVHVFGGSWTEADIIRLAASVDQASTHILARSLVDAAHHQNLSLTVPSDVVEVTGQGVSAQVDGLSVSVGRLGWLLEGKTEPTSIEEFRRRIQRLSPTSMYVSIGGEVVAAIVFDDQIRPDASHTIRSLRRIGIERIVMATGDQPQVARSVGIAIGVDDVLAEVTPSEKVTALEDLQMLGVTAMVGDGINDAPALAAADIGVAMGARGATASSEAADVVLVVDHLERLVDAIHISKRTRRIATQSVVVGMGLSLIAMSMASFGLLLPIAGALIQEGIDVIAIVNSLRALRGKTPAQAGPKLDPALSDRLRTEHDELIPKLQIVRSTADALDTIPPGEAKQSLERLEEFLVEQILPHETDDEDSIYPQIASVLPGEDPMAAMSRTHREIFHLVDVFRRQLSDIPSEGPEPIDILDLRRTLYSLYAILHLHFDQEEALYMSLRLESRV